MNKWRRPSEMRTVRDGVMAGLWDSWFVVVCLALYAFFRVVVFA